ncbi:MAG: SNF2 helicase associated domain-containing protein [Desulfovibrionaceae bacterium]|nr:SNF2 helicase associated domain-containing protein [Desulfovibrionaceae bacterium]
MRRSEQNAVYEICQKFLQEHIPEYVRDTALEIIAENGIQKVDIQEGENWEARGVIQGEDFQVYTPTVKISFADLQIRHQCNCQGAFSGSCSHIAALILKLIQDLREEDKHVDDEITTQTRDWKQTFHSFFSSEVEPETGHHYLIFRLAPEQDRLRVSFFRARQNKTAISTVHTEISLEQILANPSWCEYSPMLLDVAKQIGQYLDYYGHCIEIPEGLISWFFWAVRNEYYLLWKDTDKHCVIENSPLSLQLNPCLNDAGLTFELLMKREGRPPIHLHTGADDEITFHGLMPMWVAFQHNFYPVQTSLPPELVHTLIRESPLVPQEEVPEFLDRVWTRLSAADLYEPQKFLTRMEPLFQPAKYCPKLFLDEEGSLLTLEIENLYETIHGEFPLKGPNPDFQTGSYTYDGSTYLIRRHQEEESKLLAELETMNFQSRSSNLWFLEPEEAISFLLDHYPSLLEKYRVFGEKALSRYKVRTTQGVVQATVMSNEKDKWFSLDIAVNYQGQTLPLEKVWKAWARGKRYVQLKDGSYTSLPEAWLKKFADKLTALGMDPSKPPQEKYKQFEAPILDSILDDIPNAQTDAFWNTLRTKIHSFREIVQLDPPKGLRATLRSYQQQGLSYLNFLYEYNFGGILADEMGLGKTIQTLSFIQYLIERKIKGPNLIIVPTSVLPNWEREAKKYVPDLKLLVIYGTRRDNMFKQLEESDLALTTYALLRRDLEELQKFKFTCVILDEAQNIKNPNTITARSVRHVQSRLRICLSGTPIENNLFELWSLFEFLMPGFLGSQHAFQRGVVKPIKEGDTATLDYLRTRVKPFILRRTKAEVAKDLPPKIESVVCCALEDEQAELYASLAKKLREKVFADVDKNGLSKCQMSILDALLKLRQICCHPRLLKIDIPGFSNNLPSGKFDAFKNMISEIVEGGHKVLVFSQFVQMLQIIKQWLDFSHITYCYLDGKSKDRFDQVDRFNTDETIPIFLISLKAGGTGLNLTSADYVIHYDPWWNPAMENQATDRTHRIGQTRQVFSYKLICENTVEEKILKLQDLKRNVAEAIIPGQDSMKSLTREDLEMLFDV